MINPKHICQSCSMPMTEEFFAKNADGTPNNEYCKFCMHDGKLDECTIEQMADICADFDVRDGRAADKENALYMYNAVLPMLKRWGGTGTMEYETVTLDKKIICGIKARTSNTSSEMKTVIGDLWKKFFGEGILAGISDKKSPLTYGLYDNYSSDFLGEYDITVGCEVGAENLSDKLVTKIIPSGKYAKFTINTDSGSDVGTFWARLWLLELDRSYTADFEEYISETEVNIYIALK